MKPQKFVVAMVCVALLAVIGLDVAPPSLAGSIGGTEVGLPQVQTVAPLTWNLAADFRVTPNQANPNPDSHGNANVWYFMAGATLQRDPATYSLVTTFYPDVTGIMGLQGWVGAEPTGYFPDGLPSFVKNTTGSVQVPNATFPPGAFALHPAIAQLAVVGWRSPISGAISISGGVTDLFSPYGDGILWYIDKGSTNLASGSFPNGGSQLFQDGTNGNAIANISVKQGDFIYFALHPNGDYFGDTTQWDVTITQLDVTPPTINVSETKTDAAGNKYVEIKVRDKFSGIAKIEVLKSINANTVLPRNFTVGTNRPITFFSTKINQTKLSFVTIRATDLAGNVAQK